jgi:hypothetical protein
MLRAVDGLAAPDVVLDPPAPGLRCRHVVKGGLSFYMLFNEGETTVRATIRTAARGARSWLDLSTGESRDAEPGETVVWAEHEMRVMCVGRKGGGEECFHQEHGSSFPVCAWPAE